MPLCSSRVSVFALFLCLVGGVACAPDRGEEAPRQAETVTPSGPPPAASPAEEAAPAAVIPPSPPEPPVLDGRPNAVASDLRDAALPDGAPPRVAARHILVSFQGAPAAPPTVRRSRTSAEERVAELRARLEEGEDFAALARTHSDGPSASRGGHLGAFGPGVMHPAFEETLFALAPGARAQVETPFGLHLVERVSLDEVRVAHLVVQWEGSHRSTATRSPDEARARVDEARMRVVGGEPFAEVAKALSDGPSAVRGGDLGWFQAGQLLPEVEEAAFALQPGEVSGVVQSALGYHLLLRLE